MIYTDKTKKAIQIMYEAHKNQVDKANVPYVFHPFFVASFMDDEDSTIVALLHDVIEDTEYDISDMVKLGFSDEIIEALVCLTHKEGEDYFEYIKRISSNPLATKVKLADLSHNSDLSRLDNVTETDLQRYHKYQKCINYLKEIYQNKSYDKQSNTKINIL